MLICVRLFQGESQRNNLHLSNMSTQKNCKENIAKKVGDMYTTSEDKRLEAMI